MLISITNRCSDWLREGHSRHIGGWWSVIWLIVVVVLLLYTLEIQREVTTCKYL